MALNHRSDSVVGEDFQQQAVLYPPIDDMYRSHAVARSIDGGRNFGQHAAGQRPVGHHSVDLRGRDAREEAACFIEHAGGVGEEHQFFGLEHLSELARYNVGVDVVCLACFADADRRDDRDEIALVEQRNRAGVNLGNFADLADVDDIAQRGVLFLDKQFLGTDEICVFAGEANGFAAALVDEVDDFLVDLSAKHHFDDFHCLRVGYAHSLYEFSFFADPRKQVFDLGSAAVHDHRVEADELEQDDIAGETVLEARVGHRIAAIFDDNGFSGELADVRQGFGKDFGFQRGRGDRGHGSLSDGWILEPRVSAGQKTLAGKSIF